jgi:hypothetical protein
MSNPELWNLDHTIAKFISEHLRAFVANGHGYPAEMTFEQWHAKLDGIATRLERYMDRLDLEMDQELEVVRAGQEAMHELAEILPALWD